MKYFVVEVTTVKGQTAQALWAHDTLEEAKSHFHSIMSSAYVNPDLTYALCMVINDKGYAEVTDRIPAINPEKS